jgi:hypothetical protein
MFSLSFSFPRVSGGVGQAKEAEHGRPLIYLLAEDNGGLGTWDVSDMATTVQDW